MTDAKVVTLMLVRCLHEVLECDDCHMLQRGTSGTARASSLVANTSRTKAVCRTRSVMQQLTLRVCPRRQSARGNAGDCDDLEEANFNISLPSVSSYSPVYKNDKRYGGSKSFAMTKESDIQQEIMTNGPVTMCYMVYDDFFDYKSGEIISTR